MSCFVTGCSSHSSRHDIENTDGQHLSFPNECICPKCFQYDINYKNLQASNPFYEALGQPLIYHAQMKQKPQPYDKKGKEPKINNNCFVKAFRWYTQDRLPTYPEKRNEKGLSEFAAWLDKKYDEFVQIYDNCNCYASVHKETLPCDDKINVSGPPPCEPCQTKIFARMRSPWSKKHRSKEHSIIIEKHLQSLEFLMEPKELSRPASEYYPQTPPNKQSKVSVVSSDSRISKKTVIKSRSFEKNVCECAPVEINRNDGSNISKRQHQKPLKSSQKVEEQKLLKPPQKVEEKKEITYAPAKEVSCQYPETKLVTTETHTQYCNSDWSCRDGYQNCSCHPTICRIPSKLVQKETSSVTTRCGNYPCKPIQIQKPLKISDNQTSTNVSLTNRFVNISSKDNTMQTSNNCIHLETSATTTRCPCKPIQIVKTLKTSDNHTSTNFSHNNRFVNISSKDNALQTSDNSINLERDCVCRYPLFMKIVYADKLKEECLRS